jgi:predicted transcriptional regulator
MLRGTGDYRIERWFAGGVPLAAVRSAGAKGSMPAVVVFHGFGGNKTDDLLRLAVPVSTVDEVSALQHPVHHVPRPPHALQRRG